jgi:hypothetical protein
MYMHFTLDDIGSSLLLAANWYFMIDIGSSLLLAANWYFMIDIGISKGNCAEFTMG